MLNNSLLLNTILEPLMTVKLVKLSWSETVTFEMISFLLLGSYKFCPFMFCCFMLVNGDEFFTLIGIQTQNKNACIIFASKIGNRKESEKGKIIKLLQSSLQIS